MDEFAWVFGLVFDPKSIDSIIEKLKDIPFPVPLLTRLTNTGLLEITLSKPLLMPVKSDLGELVREIMEEGYMTLWIEETDYEEEVRGVPEYDASYFDEEEEEDLGLGLEDEDLGLEEEDLGQEGEDLE